MTAGEPRMRAGADRPVVAIGAGLLAIAAVIVWDGLQLRASFGSQAIGPQMMPFLVGLLLAGLGVLTVLEGLRGAASRREADGFAAVGWIAGGLLAMVLLVRTAGFVPAAAVLFAATARAFGSVRPALDLAIGAVLAAAAFLFFVKVLGLTLPSGLAESWF